MIEKYLITPDVFGKKLKELREGANVKQPQLAKILGLKSQKQIQRYEKGEVSPPHEVIIHLCNYFKYDFISLLYVKPGIKTDQPTLESVRQMLADAITVIDKIGLEQRVQPVVNSDTSGQASQVFQEKQKDIQGPLSISQDKKGSGSGKSSDQRKGKVRS